MLPLFQRHWGFDARSLGCLFPQPLPATFFPFLAA